ncbi:hypothetical protein [Fodinicola feengrottensis]|uniref:Uncharacterized protein n=1 Tax=Fodinicola feengrottensis TaxID=435914 RepID=A0ABP4TTF0_9ACTN|nr:hypothetical protein [Fodinicola feengrottensis]
MTKTLGLVSDRLLTLFVPKTTASACACNDYYCTRYGCPAGYIRDCRDNCDCSKTVCGVCYRGYC